VADGPDNLRAVVRRLRKYGAQRIFDALGAVGVHGPV
jgi:hypothetical protein